MVLSSRHVTIVLIANVVVLFLLLSFLLKKEATQMIDHEEEQRLRVPQLQPPTRLIRNKRHAYVCLCGNIRAIYPTLVLFQQLINVYAMEGEFVALVPEGAVPEELLAPFALLNIKIRRIPGQPLFSPAYPVNSRSTRDRDVILWQKLRVWEMTEYDRIVVLDNDLLVLYNFDELFSSAAKLAGVPMLFRDEKIMFWEAPGEGSSNFTKAHNLHINWSGMNGGVMVIQPNMDTFKALVGAAERLSERTCCPTQEFIFRFFESTGDYQRLSPIYNFRKLQRVDPELQQQYADHIKVYHFVERNKPIILGRKQCGSDGFASKWWTVADQVDRILDRWAENDSALEEHVRRIRREAIQPALQ